MLHILFDKGKNITNFSLLNDFTNRYIEHYSPETNPLIIGWLRGCCTVLRKSKKNDTIICWYDFQAVLCYWICNLFFLKRKIICINLLLKDKPTLKNKIVSFLYKKALLSSNFKASVTSVKYGKWLNCKLGINAKYTLIHDVYRDTYKYPKEVNVKPNSVFCGGENGRDWRFMMKVAQTMPNVTFNIVMPFKVYQELKTEIRDNMNVKYNIPYTEFMEELCGSEIVCLPLDTQAPAGLLVMFQAAANLKPIIITDTVTTTEYITSERGIALPNDIKSWCEAINQSLMNMDECKKKAIRLKDYLTTYCSDKTFVNGINKMLW